MVVVDQTNHFMWKSWRFTFLFSSKIALKPSPSKQTLPSVLFPELFHSHGQALALLPSPTLPTSLTKNIQRKEEYSKESGDKHLRTGQPPCCCVRRLAFSSMIYQLEVAAWWRCRWFLCFRLIPVCVCVCVCACACGCVCV